MKRRNIFEEYFLMMFGVLFTIHFLGSLIFALNHIPNWEYWEYRVVLPFSIVVGWILAYRSRNPRK